MNSHGSPEVDPHAAEQLLGAVEAKTTVHQRETTDGVRAPRNANPIAIERVEDNRSTGFSEYGSERRMEKFRRKFSTNCSEYVVIRGNGSESDARKKTSAPERE